VTGEERYKKVVGQVAIEASVDLNVVDEMYVICEVERIVAIAVAQETMVAGKDVLMKVAWIGDTRKDRGDNNCGHLHLAECKIADLYRALWASLQRKVEYTRSTLIILLYPSSSYLFKYMIHSEGN